VTVISKFAYQATWDASQLSKGLLNTRALFAQQKKIVEDSRSPFDRLAIGQENLNKLIEKFPELAKERLRIEKQLEKQYLMEESAIRKLDSAERARLRSLMTADEKEAAIAARREKRAQKLARMGDRIRSSSSPSEMGASDRERMIGGMSSGPNWASKAAQMPGGGGGLGSLLGGVKGLGPLSVVTGGLAAGGAVVSDLISQGRDAYRDTERAGVTFEHFSGSSAKSADMMARLRTMSADSGISFKALSGGTANLMQRGFEGDDAIKRTRQLAEVSGGDPEKMARLSNALGQIKDKGRFLAEELDQLNEAGFSPMNELMKLMGMSAADVRKEMEKGNVSYDMIAKSLDMATESGGRYYGFLEKFKGTSVGAAQESAAAWEDAYSKIGQAWSPIDIGLSKLSTFVAKDLGKLAEGMSWAFGTDTKVEAEDPKVAARKKAEQERADRLAEARKREQDALKEIAARETEQNNVAMSGMQDQQFDLIKKLVPDEELAKFERTYALLSDYNKERAKTEALENFRSGYGLGDFTSKLSKEAKLEFEKTEALREQTEELEAQKKLKAEGEQIASRYMSDEQKQINALADLDKAREFGGLSQENYDRESRKLVAMDNPGESRMASSMRAGSQEAYQFMAGVQNRSQQEKVREQQEKERLQYLREQVNLLKEIRDKTEPLQAAG
jgi:tape measure domain-containing protein